MRPMNSPLTQSPAWQNLVQHAKDMGSVSLADIVLGDPARLENCTIALEGLQLNFALQHVTPKTIDLLTALAEQQNLTNWRERMFAGEKINTSENHAALHTALRQKSDQPVMVDGRDVIPDIKTIRKKMEMVTAVLRDGRRRGATGKPIRHIVNIGIGGSDLGPRLAVRALAPYATGPHVHFVANLDAFDIVSTLENLDPAETLFVVVSKTFATQETLRNATTARQWVTEKLGAQAVAHHFVAVSANPAKVVDFGIPLESIFPIWDWVGGRFSLWSAVGLTAMLTLGVSHFDKMCDGAAAMDAHFHTAPLQKNMPVLMALFGIWNRNFRNMSAQAVLPYGERLRDLPRYFQQLEMESNGKTVTRDGQAIDYATAPIIFGECGTVGQHSFHQWLHQGSEIVPVDFIGVRQDDLGHPEHHRSLLANMLAQASALAFGRTGDYPGGRPSNLIMLDHLEPYHFGMLLALYEHKTFAQGVIWGVNSFDQPGVELGKKMAHALELQTTPQDRQGAFLSDLWKKSL